MLKLYLNISYKNNQCYKELLKLVLLSSTPPLLGSKIGTLCLFTSDSLQGISTDYRIGGNWCWLEKLGQIFLYSPINCWSPSSFILNKTWFFHEEASEKLVFYVSPFDVIFSMGFTLTYSQNLSNCSDNVF